MFLDSDIQGEETKAERLISSHVPKSISFRAELIAEKVSQFYTEIGVQDQIRNRIIFHRVCTTLILAFQELHNASNFPIVVILQVCTSR
jgi:hypothetical protein